MGNDQADALATRKFKEGYNCAQAIVHHYAEKIGEPAALAFRAATGFGAGMGRKQQVCGALSGGILVIGCLYGRSEGDAKPAQESAYAKTRELLDRFETERGSVICKRLLGDCDLLTDAGRKRFADERLIERCEACVVSVARILDGILE